MTSSTSAPYYMFICYYGNSVHTNLSFIVQLNVLTLVLTLVSTSRSLNMISNVLLLFDNFICSNSICLFKERTIENFMLKPFLLTFWQIHRWLQSAIIILSVHPKA